VEEGKKFGGVILGSMATVLDREVCGVREELEDVLSKTNVLILSDL